MVQHLQSADSHQELMAALKNANADGMQYFDGELEKLVRSGVVDLELALTHATDADELRKALQAN
jgi:Tfp pilus assembly ATPase PilU